MKLHSETTFKTYTNHRQEPYFTYLKQGLKTVEGRLQKGLYADLKVGDHIIVQNEEETDSVEVEIVGVRTYADFAAMLEAESVSKVLPDKTSVTAGVQLYRTFYTPEKEKVYGVLAIAVRLV